MLHHILLTGFCSMLFLVEKRRDSEAFAYTKYIKQEVTVSFKNVKNILKVINNRR